MDTYQKYRENGFIILKSVFSKDVLESLWRIVDKIFEMQLRQHGLCCHYDDNGRLPFTSKIALFKKNKDAYISCMKECQNIPSMMSLGNNQDILSALNSIGVGTPVYSTKPIFTLMSSQTSASYSSWKMPPHQDWRSIQGSINNAVAWIALDDCDSEVGPLEIVPKSHKLGLLDVEKDEWYYKLKQEFSEDEYIRVPVEAGDCILFSSFLVHRSGTNTSEHLARASIQFRYNDVEEPSFISRGYPSTYGSDRPTKDYVLDEGLTITADDVKRAL